MFPGEERKPCGYFPEKRGNTVDAPERREEAMWMLPIEERKPCGGSPEKIGNPVDSPDRREETLWMVLREKGKPLEYVWMLPREE
jgi:hypothetical protein